MMLKLAVTGARGFIGSRFIELYAHHFAETVALTSQNAPLNNAQAIDEQLQNIDVVVHTAFDHNYQYNEVGLKNIIRACIQNKVKRLVFLSTVSVYQPDLQGILNETSPYSTLKDPYAQEKIKLEKLLHNLPFEVVILQPSIVYGLAGNWSNYAFFACKHRALRLPQAGQAICNAVYIDDVCQAIFQVCTVPNLKYEKFLISSEKPISWQQFYQAHHQLLTNKGLFSQLTIENTLNQQKYHDNVVFNLMIMLWFHSILGNFFNLFIKYIKQMRKKKIATSNVMQIDKIDNDMNLLGITRQVHNAKFSIDISHAKQKLSYQPKFDLDLAIQDMLKR